MFRTLTLTLTLTLTPSATPQAVMPSGGRQRRPVAVAANPYEVLRVRETATAQEIKAAYRALAKRFHPDVSPAGGPDFVEIRRAYATLSDPAERARYHRSLGRVGFCAVDRMPKRIWETDQCW